MICVQNQHKIHILDAPITMIGQIQILMDVKIVMTELMNDLMPQLGLKITYVYILFKII